MLEKQKNKKKRLNSYIKYSGLTTQMAVIIIVGTYLGSYIDTSFNNKTPIYTIVCSLASIVFALYYVLKGIINKK